LGKKSRPLGKKKRNTPGGGRGAKKKTSRTSKSSDQKGQPEIATAEKTRKKASGGSWENGTVRRGGEENLEGISRGDFHSKKKKSTTGGEQKKGIAGGRGRKTGGEAYDLGQSDVEKKTIQKKTSGKEDIKKMLHVER